MSPEEFRQSIRDGVTTTGFVVAFNIVRDFYYRINLTPSTYIALDAAGNPLDIIKEPGNPGRETKLRFIYDETSDALDANIAILNRRTEASDKQLQKAQAKKDRQQDSLDRANGAKP